MDLKTIIKKVTGRIKRLFYPVYTVGKRFLFPPKIPINTNGKVLIHLGCGAINNPQFINIDAANLPHVHFVQDIRNLAVLPSNFADLLYSSHALEHISHLEVPKTLKEWARVIKRGGTIKLSVPDFDKMVNIYQASDQNMRSIESPLMGGQDYPHNFHMSVFNEKYLSDLLTKAGFYNIRTWDASKDIYGFNDFARTFEGSLNLEAEKK